MRVVHMLVLCFCTCVITGPTLAVGFDPRGAQEAAGLSREFDDATRLQQLEQAPQLPPPPVISVPKRTPPVEQQAGADSTPLLQATQKVSDEQAKQVLQQAESQIQQQQRGGFWQTMWRFLVWSSVGAALSWAIWSWIARRASDGVKWS